MTPTTEQGVIEAIQSAHDAAEPLAIAGRNSKQGLLRPVQAARTLSTAGLTGITLYSPSELIISARAGTTLAEIEAAVAEKGQHLVAERGERNAPAQAVEQGATELFLQRMNAAGERGLGQKQRHRGLSPASGYENNPSP